MQPLAADRRLSAPSLSQRLSLSLSTDTLLCMFAAAVSLQEVTGAFWPAQKLRIHAAEGMTKRGGCLRDCSTRVLACAAFQTRTGAVRRSGALICCFSVAVSLQVMRWLYALTAPADEFPQWARFRSSCSQSPSGNICKQPPKNPPPVDCCPNLFGPSARPLRDLSIGVTWSPIGEGPRLLANR